MVAIEVGSELFYTGKDFTFPSGNKLVKGTVPGKVMGMAAGEKNMVLMSFPGNSAAVGVPGYELSADKPKLSLTKSASVKMGFAVVKLQVGETVFYTGEDYTFPSKNKLTKGAQGTVWSLVEGRKDRVAVMMAGNVAPVGVPVTELSRTETKAAKLLKSKSGRVAVTAEVEAAAPAEAMLVEAEMVTESTAVEMRLVEDIKEEVKPAEAPTPAPLSPVVEAAPVAVPEPVVMAPPVAAPVVETKVVAAPVQEVEPPAGPSQMKLLMMLLVLFVLVSGASYYFNMEVPEAVPVVVKKGLKLKLPFKK